MTARRPPSTLFGTALQLLAAAGFSFRQVAQNPVQRELIIAFGAMGYVALCEIVSISTVVVPAVRQQREEDCH